MQDGYKFHFARRERASIAHIDMSVKFEEWIEVVAEFKAFEAAARADYPLAELKKLTEVAGCNTHDLGGIRSHLPFHPDFTIHDFGEYGSHLVAGRISQLARKAGMTYDEIMRANIRSFFSCPEEIAGGLFDAPRKVSSPHILVGYVKWGENVNPHEVLKYAQDVVVKGAIVHAGLFEPRLAIEYPGWPVSIADYMPKDFPTYGCGCKGCKSHSRHYPLMLDQVYHNGMRLYRRVLTFEEAIRCNRLHIDWFFPSLDIMTIYFAAAKNEHAREIMRLIATDAWNLDLCFNDGAKNHIIRRDTSQAVHHCRKLRACIAYYLRQQHEMYVNILVALPRIPAEVALEIARR